MAKGMMKLQLDPQSEVSHLFQRTYQLDVVALKNRIKPVVLGIET